MIGWNKKRNDEPEKSSKSEIIKYGLIVITGWILIFGLWLYQVKKAWTPEVYTKEVFTEEEQGAIIEILGEKFDNVDNVQIDFVKYSRAREAWNIIYISNANKEMINGDYKLNLGDHSIDTWDGEKVLAEWYHNKSDLYTECYIYETETGTKAMIMIRGTYKELYEIVKD